ncbi:MAG TPA: hypothetical protein VEV41_13120 [Terriglobales bacterium]|nr:hypothetical protein [Terriglobales bacterium]
MNFVNFLPEHRASKALLLLIFLGSFLLSLAHAARPAAVPGQVDFPLALKTKWTNHLHQEMGEGVHFGPQMSKFANGNSLDVSVITEIVGSDLVNGEKYMRRETRMKGALWQTEWLRQTANGLLLGKSRDAEAGDEVLIVPPEKMLSPTLKAGESWDWKAADASAVTQIKVVGPADLTVPAGTFHTTEISYDTAVEIEGGAITVHQTSWFASGVGYVKQDTKTLLGDHLLTHVVFTLEKFEPAPGAKPAGG